MAHKNDEPAFPCEVSNQSDDGMLQTGDTTWKVPGMSLRDYFAAQALVVFAAIQSDTVEQTAHLCYAQADAMMVARKK